MLVKHKESHLVRFIAITIACAFLFTDIAFALSPEKSLSQESFRPRFQSAYDMTHATPVTKFVISTLPPGGIDALLSSDPSRVERISFSFTGQIGRKHEVLFVSVPALFKREGLITFIDQDSVNGNRIPVVYIDKREFNIAKIRSAAADIIARIKSDAGKAEARSEAEEPLIGHGFTIDEIEKSMAEPMTPFISWQDSDKFKNAVDALENELKKFIRLKEGEAAAISLVDRLLKTLDAFKRGDGGRKLGIINSRYVNPTRYYLEFGTPKVIGMGEEFFDGDDLLSKCCVEALFHAVFHASENIKTDPSTDIDGNEGTHYRAMRVAAEIFWKLEPGELPRLAYITLQDLERLNNNRLGRAIREWKNLYDAMLNRNTEKIVRELRSALSTADTNTEKLFDIFTVCDRATHGQPDHPVEARYPLLHAIGLLNRDEKKKIADTLTGKNPELRSLPIADSALLMIQSEDDIPEGWIARHAHNLINRRVWEVAAEVFNPAGGLGRVERCHCGGMESLLKRGGKDLHIVEPYYDRDSNGAAVNYSALIGAEIKPLNDGAPVEVMVGHKKAYAVFYKADRPDGSKVFLIKGFKDRELKNPYYTRSIYDYRKDDCKNSWEMENLVTKWEFSAFFSLASLKLVRMVEEKDRAVSADAWRAPVVHFNDGQLGLAPLFRNMYYAKDAILKDAFIAYSTHTYKNRCFFGSDVLQELDIPESYRQYFRHHIGKELGLDYAEVVDFTSAGIRSADWAGGVSAKHVDDVYMYDKDFLKDHGKDLTAVTNGDNRAQTAYFFRKYMQEAWQEKYPQEAVDFDHPTPEQVLMAKQRAKRELGLDPDRLVISYSGRGVDEKLNNGRAFSMDSIEKMLDMGIQVVIGMNPNPEGKIIDAYQRFQAGLSEERARNFKLMCDIDIEKQRHILAASDAQIQDSSPRTEAAGYSESNIGACGGLEIAPPWTEGLLQSQGIEIDFAIPGIGNTIRPKFEFSKEDLERYIAKEKGESEQRWRDDFDLRARRAYMDSIVRLSKVPPEELAKYQASAVRISQVLEARLTSAEYLRQWSNGIEKKTGLPLMDYPATMSPGDIERLLGDISVPSDLPIPTDLSNLYQAKTDQSGVAKIGYNDKEIIIWAFNPTDSDEWTTFDLGGIIDHQNPSGLDDIMYSKESWLPGEEGRQRSKATSPLEFVAHSLIQHGISVQMGPTKPCEIIRLKKKDLTVAREGTAQEGPALFVDPVSGDIRGLTDAEHEALHNAIRVVVNFNKPVSVEYDENGVRKLNEKEIKRLVDIIPGAGRGPPASIKIDAFIIENGYNSKLAAALPDKYKYLARCVITHAGRWRTDPSNNPHANLFIPRSAYERLLSDKSTAEELAFWRKHEMGHLNDRDAPIDSELTYREKRLACSISGKIVKETKFDKNNRYIWNHKLGVGRIVNYDEASLLNDSKKIAIEFVTPDGLHLYREKMHVSAIVEGNVYGSFFLLTGKRDKDEFEAGAKDAKSLGRPMPISMYDRKSGAKIDKEERERLAAEAKGLLREIRDPSADFVLTTDFHLLKRVADTEYPLKQTELTDVKKLLEDVKTTREERKKHIYNIDNATIVERLIIQQLFSLGITAGSPMFASHLRKRLPQAWNDLDGKLTKTGKIRKPEVDSLIAIPRSDRVILVNGWVTSLTESGRYSERAAQAEVGRWIRRAVPAVEAMLKKLDPYADVESAAGKIGAAKPHDRLNLSYLLRDMGTIDRTEVVLPLKWGKEVSAKDLIALASQINASAQTDASMSILNQAIFHIVCSTLGIRGPAALKPLGDLMIIDLNARSKNGHATEFLNNFDPDGKTAMKILRLLWAMQKAVKHLPESADSSMVMSSIQDCLNRCDYLPHGFDRAKPAALETGGWVRPDLSGINQTRGSPRVVLNITPEEVLKIIRPIVREYCREKNIIFESDNVIIGQITAEDMAAAGIGPQRRDAILYRTAMLLHDSRNNTVWVKIDPLLIGRIMAYQIANLELKEPILPDGENAGAVATLNLATTLIYRTIIHEIGKHGANDKERAAIIRIYPDEELAESVSSGFAPYNQGARLFDRIFYEEGVTEKEEFIKALDLYLDTNPIIYRKIKHKESVREAAIGWYESWARTCHNEPPFRRCYTISPSPQKGPTPQAGTAVFDTGVPQSSTARATAKADPSYTGEDDALPATAPVMRPGMRSQYEEEPILDSTAGPAEISPEELEKGLAVVERSIARPGSRLKDTILAVTRLVRMNNILRHAGNNAFSCRLLTHLKKRILRMLSDPEYLAYYDIKRLLLFAFENILYLENAKKIAHEKAAYIGTMKSMGDDRVSRERYYIQQRNNAAQVMAKLQEAWAGNVRLPDPAPFDAVAMDMINTVWGESEKLTTEQRIKFHASLIHMRANHLMLGAYIGGFDSIEKCDPHRVLEMMTGVQMKKGINAIRYDPKNPFTVYFEFKDRKSYLAFDRQINQGHIHNDSTGVYMLQHSASFGYSVEPFRREIQHANFTMTVMPLFSMIYENSYDQSKTGATFVDSLSNLQYDRAKIIMRSVAGRMLDDMTDEFLAHISEGDRLSDEDVLKFYTDQYSEVHGIDDMKKAIDEWVGDADEKASLISFLKEEMNRLAEDIRGCERIAEAVIASEGVTRGMAILHMVPLSRYRLLPDFYNLDINEPAPIKDVSLAERLETIRGDDYLMEKALSKGGIRLQETFESLRGLGIFVPIDGKEGFYKFADMMIGEDPDTGTLLNAIIAELKISASLPAKEVAKMAIINEINKTLTIDETKTTWHIIDKNVIPRAQQDTIITRLDKFDRENPKAKERILILDDLEIVSNIIAIRDKDKNAVINVALSSIAQVEAYQYTFGEKKVKPLVFQSLGNFIQLEGVIAALRALEREDLAALLRIYSVMAEKPFKNPPTAISKNPIEFALNFIFDLPSASSVPADDMRNMNDRLFELLTAA
jgi:glycogen synthase